MPFSPHTDLPTSLYSASVLRTVSVVKKKTFVILDAQPYTTDEILKQFS